jgi:antirestriction protein ArdC/phage/plasmid primase-like uncharacterized protein
MSGKAFHEQVADALVQQLRAGTAPWQQPWKSDGGYLPINPLTEKRYRGVNAVHLLAQGRGDPRWMTYRQAQELSAQVKEGERGTLIQYWKFAEQQPQRDAAGNVVLDARGKPETVTVELERPRVFHAVVFNAEQVEGLPAFSAPRLTWDPVERAETILKRSEAKIEHGGDRAFYSLANDSIRLPRQEQFESAAGYYATALHELGHWTGHSQRLDRDLAHPFGSEGYAREELRAEIASMIVGSDLGLGHDPSQHVAYVAHWISVLEKDPLEILRACSAAEKISDFIVAFERQQIVTNRVEHEPREERSMNTDAEPNPEPKLKRTNERVPDERFYISVPFRERDQAKAEGARWDRARRSWYVPSGVDQARFTQWTERSTSPAPTHAETGEGRVYLAVPFSERAAAKAAGARWDRAAKCWFADAQTPPPKLERWLPTPGAGEQSPPMDPRAEFASALREVGCVLAGVHPIMDGKQHRIPIEGDRRGEAGGFYVAHLDGHPAGYIKNHRTGVEITWKAKGYVLDSGAREKLRAEAAQKRQERAAEQARIYEETAKALATELAGLSAATLPTPYMAKKRIATHPGVYVDAAHRTCVPAIDIDGKLWAVQYIDAEGNKRFAKSSRKRGCFHAVGGLQRLEKADVLVIAEGYATAATIAELLGKPTVAALDAGNLVLVAEALHKKFPNKPVLIAGDDDQAQQLASGKNPGRRKAEEAASAVGGRVVFPLFAPREQQDNPKAFSDFNDLAVRSVLSRDGAASQLRHAYETALREGARKIATEERQVQAQRRTRARAR